MKRPCCVGCKASMYAKKNGVIVLEMAGSQPYRLWSADLWACRSCDHEVLSGWGDNPIATQGDPDFDATVADYRKLRYFMEIDYTPAQS